MLTWEGSQVILHFSLPSLYLRPISFTPYTGSVLLPTFFLFLAQTQLPPKWGVKFPALTRPHPLQGTAVENSVRRASGAPEVG